MIGSLASPSKITASLAKLQRAAPLSLSVGFLLGTLTAFLACKAIPKTDSQTEGVGGAIADDFIIPLLKTAAELEVVKKTIVSGASKFAVHSSVEVARNETRALLYQQLKTVNGIRRNQLKAILQDLVGSSANHCGGASCARVFGFGSEGVDGFLNESLALLRGDSRLLAAEQRDLRRLLIGSLRDADYAKTLTVARGGIEDPRKFLWDNWFVAHYGKYYRFTLEAPRVFPDGFHPPFADDFPYPKDHVYSGSKALADDRHHLARIGLYTSMDGKGWSYEGVAIDVDPNPARFDSHVIWSGNAHSINGRLVVPYTGRSRTLDPTHPDKWLQRIGMAVMDDQTGKFIKLGRNPILDPLAKRPDGRNLAESLGYDISSDSKVIMAWRDPYIYHDHASDTLHLFFAAKVNKSLLSKRVPGANGSGAIGHAVAKAGSLDQWTLLPPVDLPAAYSQFELPVVIKRGDEFVMFSSVVEFTGNRRSQSLRAYRSDSLTGDWQPIKKGSDKIMDLTRLYGVNLAPSIDGKDLYGVSFYDKELALSPMVKLQWDHEGVPFFPPEYQW